MAQKPSDQHPDLQMGNRKMGRDSGRFRSEIESETNFKDYETTLFIPNQIILHFLPILFPTEDYLHLRQRRCLHRSGLDKRCRTSALSRRTIGRIHLRLSNRPAFYGRMD